MGSSSLIELYVSDSDDDGLLSFDEGEVVEASDIEAGSFLYVKECSFGSVLQTRVCSFSSLLDVKERLVFFEIRLLFSGKGERVLPSGERGSFLCLDFAYFFTGVSKSDDEELYLVNLVFA